MSGTVRIAILANGAKARQELESVGKTGSRVGASLKKGLAVGAVALGGLAVAAKGAVDAAAELSDTVGATRVIYGKASKDVEKFAKRTAKSLGLSQQKALDAAGQFGTFGKAAGLQGKKLSGFSKRMIQLSGDLASFKGGTAAEAVEAIGAAMRGETEPIRRYGVLLDDASLRQEALSQGLIKTTKQALTPQQKTLAAYNLILKQTSDAQGDFARTSDSAKNKAQVQAAQFEDLKAKIGTGLLPVYGALLTAGIALTDWFTDKALPAVGEFAGSIKDALGPILGDAVTSIRTKFIPAVRDVVRELGKKLPKIDIKDLFGDLAKDARAFAQPTIDGFTTGIRTGNWGPFGTALGTALGDAIGGFANLAGDVAGAIGDWAASVDWLQVGKKVGAQALPFVIGFGNSLFDPLTSKEFWKKNWDEVILFAIAFIPYGKGGTSIASRIGSKLGLDKGITGAIIGGLEGSIGRIGRAVIDFARFIGRKFLEGFKAAFPTIGKGLDDLFTEIGARFLYAGDAVKKVIPQYVGDVFALLGRTFGDSIATLGRLGARIIGGIVRGMFGAIRTFTLPYRQGATLIAQDVAATAVRALGWGRRIFGGLVRGAVSVVRTILTPFRQGAQLAVESVVRLGGRLYTSGAAAVGRLRAGIASRAGRFRDVLFDAGVNVMQGFLSGIQSFYNNHVAPYLNWITSRLPFEKGPAARDKKILFKSGLLVMGGFQSGLESQYRDVRSSLGSFTSSLGSTGLSASTSAASALATSTPVAVSTSAAAPQVVVTFAATGDPLIDALWAELRKRISVRGGNVQLALGRG